MGEEKRNSLISYDFSCRLTFSKETSIGILNSPGMSRYDGQLNGLHQVRGLGDESGSTAITKDLSTLRVQNVSLRNNSVARIEARHYPRSLYAGVYQRGNQWPLPG